MWFRLQDDRLASLLHRTFNANSYHVFWFASLIGIAIYQIDRTRRYWNLTKEISLGGRRRRRTTDRDAAAKIHVFYTLDDDSDLPCIKKTLRLLLHLTDHDDDSLLDFRETAAVDPPELPPRALNYRLIVRSVNRHPAPNEVAAMPTSSGLERSKKTVMLVDLTSRRASEIETCTVPGGTAAGDRRQVMDAALSQALKIAMDEVTAALTTPGGGDDLAGP